MVEDIVKIEKQAICGTLLSNDCLVTIEPGDDGLSIQIDSPVIHAFGEQIEKVIREKLKDMNVTTCKLRIDDKGALDYTIMARVEVAVMRSNE